MDYSVEVVELQERPTAVVSGVVAMPEIGDFLGGAFGEVLAVIAAQGRHPAGMPFGCYMPGESGMAIEAGFPVSAPVVAAGRVAPGVLPGGQTAHVMHVGAYDGVGAAYEAVFGWLAANGWEVSGPPWEEYLDGPEVAAPRTAVYVPCRQAGHGSQG